LDGDGFFFLKFFFFLKACKQKNPFFKNFERKFFFFSFKFVFITEIVKTY